MNYKLFMYRNRKLYAIREVENAVTALNWFNIWREQIENEPYYYYAGHEYIILMYYKNKRIKTKKLKENT